MEIDNFDIVFDDGQRVHLHHWKSVAARLTREDRLAIVTYLDQVGYWDVYHVFASAGATNATRTLQCKFDLESGTWNNNGVQLNMSETDKFIASRIRFGRETCHDDLLTSIGVRR